MISGQNVQATCPKSGSNPKQETRNLKQFFKLLLFSMEVNDALVENLANLARLQFNEAEKEIIRKDRKSVV
jgi:hypothetical protein